MQTVVASLSAAAIGESCGHAAVTMARMVRRSYGARYLHNVVAGADGTRIQYDLRRRVLSLYNPLMDEVVSAGESRVNRL
jgi:hypothetical protein